MKSRETERGEEQGRKKTREGGIRRRERGKEWKGGKKVEDRGERDTGTEERSPIKNVSTGGLNVWD